MHQMLRLIVIMFAATWAVGQTPFAAERQPAAADSECGGDVLALQVLLARQSFSPGLIDGIAGSNFERALTAFQNAHGLPPTGSADCATVRALGGHTAAQAIAVYRITEADTQGPFVPRIPASLPDQAALPSLAYTSVTEKLSERFHTSPETLRRLNPDSRFTAGTEIRVPAVEPFDADAKPAPVADAAGLSVTVTREESALRVTRGDGTVVFFAPVTTGSKHDPLPLGDWQVRSVTWMPSFHYNPDLFWDAEPGDAKATLKPGPNNPVGVVWIDLNLEHYGIHGTPEPSRVGHAESHGCVRLTNWDAARVAALAVSGTPVRFR